METTKKIIIIDDDENICKSLSLILKTVGYVTDTAKTGNKAISKIKHEFFNIALLDIKLPDVEGTELLTSIKEINPDIEIIMITGEASLESAIIALNKGASAYLRKPLQPEDLLSYIKNFLEKQSLSTAKRELEQKLKESEEKLRMFMNSATDGFVIFDPELNYIDANNVSLEILGMNREDLIGKNILDLAPNLKETGRYDKYLDVIKTGKSFSTEDVIFNKLDGSLSLFLSVRAFKVGENFGIIFTDITERKNVEIALKKREYDLGERVKELTCLYGISKLAENREISIETIFRKILKLIPSGWQFPENLCARIIFNDQEFKTKNFVKTKWSQKVVIKKFFKVVGTLEVFYAQEMPEFDEGPFLKEERNLIDALSEILGRYIEQKDIEDELKKSENKLKDVLEVIPIGVSISTSEGEMLEVNSYAFKVFGYNTKEEFLKIPTLDHYYDPKDRDRFVKLNEKGYVKDFNTLFKHKDGTLMWGAVNSITQKIEDQTVFLNVFQDISERIKAEEEIADLARFPSENPSPVLRISEEFVIYVNNVGQNLFKIKEGNRIPILFRDMVKKAFKEHSSQPMEIKMDNRVYSLVINPVKGTGYANIYGMDITKLKLTEIKMLESEQQCSQILNSMVDAIYVIDNDLRIIVMNPAFKQWLKNLNLDTDLIGQKIQKSFPFLPDSVINEYKKVLDTGKTLHSEESTIINGKEFFTETTKIPIISSGKVIQVITIIRDITDRKLKEESVRV